jgi:transposase
MKSPKPELAQGNSPTKQDYQTLERQNRAMQKELDLRKKEIDFLKKASAYFASLKP